MPLRHRDRPEGHREGGRHGRASRHAREAVAARWPGSPTSSRARLDEMQQALFARALAFREEHTTRVVVLRGVQAGDGRTSRVRHRAAGAGARSARRRSRRTRRRRSGTSRSAVRTSPGPASNAAVLRPAKPGSPKPTDELGLFAARGVRPQFAARTGWLGSDPPSPGLAARLGSDPRSCASHQVGGGDGPAGGEALDGGVTAGETLAVDDRAERGGQVVAPPRVRAARLTHRRPPRAVRGTWRRRLLPAPRETPPAAAPSRAGCPADRTAPTGCHATPAPDAAPPAPCAMPRGAPASRFARLAARARDRRAAASWINFAALASRHERRLQQLR